MGPSCNTIQPRGESSFLGLTMNSTDFRDTTAQIDEDGAFCSRATFLGPRDDLRSDAGQGSGTSFAMADSVVSRHSSTPSGIRCV